MNCSCSSSSRLKVGLAVAFIPQHTRQASALMDTLNPGGFFASERRATCKPDLQVQTEGGSQRRKSPSDSAPTINDCVIGPVQQKGGGK